MKQKDGLLLLAKGHKIRLSTWWWGRYIYLKDNYLLDQSGKNFPRVELTYKLPNPNAFWEIYNEEIHGLKAH